MAQSRWTFPFVFSCGLIAACSGSENDAGGGDNAGGSEAERRSGLLPSPCTLASEAELEAIIADDVADFREQASAGDPFCTWYDAENSGVMTLYVFATTSLYDISRSSQGSRPLEGVGDAAHIGRLAVVYVAKSGRSFFAQSLVPAEDGVVSPQIRAAASGIEGDDLAEYEASYRVAKLVSARF